MNVPMEDIVDRCKRLEAALEKSYGATGKGLHEKTSSVEAKLPADIVKKLRFVASIRNKVVHEPGDMDQDTLTSYIETCDQIERVFSRTKTSGGGASYTSSTASTYTHPGDGMTERAWIFGIAGFVITFLAVAKEGDFGDALFSAILVGGICAAMGYFIMWVLLGLLVICLGFFFYGLYRVAHVSTAMALVLIVPVPVFTYIGLIQATKDLDRDKRVLWTRSIIAIVLAVICQACVLPVLRNAFTDYHHMSSGMLFWFKEWTVAEVNRVGVIIASIVTTVLFLLPLYACVTGFAWLIHPRISLPSADDAGLDESTKKT